ARALMLRAIPPDWLRANLFHQPIRGVLDLVSVLLGLVVFLGIPQTFLSQGNVTVDLVDRFVGRRGVLAFRTVAAALTVAFLSLLFWHMFAPARDAFQFCDLQPA